MKKSKFTDSQIIGALTQIIEWRGKPRTIRCDNGPEYDNNVLKEWIKNSKLSCNIFSQVIFSKTLMLKGLTAQ